MYAGDEDNGDEVTSGVTQDEREEDGDQDEDEERADNYPVLYVDGDLQQVETFDLERVQLEFDETANGVQSEAQERGPLGWCNSATIHLDRADDAVHVLISVGDPRGAFGFTVRRLQDGRLIMHTPYPGEGMPHMPLTEIRPGTYEIGS